jgi:NADH-quinone oxidoreductase subunit G
MPRPEQTMVTITIDGHEISAPENVMLVDGAKYGDVEIPVFCYEPKLGAPVGACRMCLVEIEGIPKLQTACSTPVKDGMVVHTQTDRVQQAQNAVVEFLLVNHPLDCPVCDKGGECPLQDITFGWGPGTSRFKETKRHFQKPLALSPLIAIDRERCILCYRCVRFSQEISEDYQLVLHERGAHTFVGTFDGHPYVAPFSGNIIELCPVGALTSQAYRFRARPWDIEGGGSICTHCPTQCNVTFTVRDERVLRVLGRDHEGVDDGWLCDRGRFGYQAIHVDERITHPLVRENGELVSVTWERTLDEAAQRLEAAGSAVGAVVGGETTNEEGYLLGRLVREAIGSEDIDARPNGGPSEDLRRALGDPALQATIPDLEFAHTVLVLDTEPVDDAPVLDLRIRKGVRRNGVKLAVATSRPSSLDPNATAVARFAPGAGEAFAAALSAALGGGGHVSELAPLAGADPDEVLAIADLLKDSGEDVVILYGERLIQGPRADHAARALLNAVRNLGLPERPPAPNGSGLLEIPAGGGNGRGLREIGIAPRAGGRSTAEIAAAAGDGDLAALYLLHVDPLRDLPGRTAWTKALASASTVIAHSAFVTEGILAHADVVFPAESYAEKEGTMVNLDGRLQRVRRAIGRQGATQAEWQVLANLAKRLGVDTDVLTSSMATQQLVETVPFWAGVTLDEIGGRGVRWPIRDAAAAWPAPQDPGPFGLETPPRAASPNGALRLGTFRSIWASTTVQASPALQFLHPRQRAELSPADAERIGVGQGDTVLVGSGDDAIEATVALRAAMPAGSVFVETGIPEDAANGLQGPLVEVAPK